MGDIKCQQQVERRALLASGMRIFPPLDFTIGGEHVRALLEANKAHLSTCCCFVISFVFDLDGLKSSCFLWNVEKGVHWVVSKSARLPFSTTAKQQFYWAKLHPKAHKVASVLLAGSQ